MEFEKLLKSIHTDIEDILSAGKQYKEKLAKADPTMGMGGEMPAENPAPEASPEANPSADVPNVQSMDDDALFNLVQMALAEIETRHGSEDAAPEGAAPAAAPLAQSSDEAEPMADEGSPEGFEGEEPAPEMGEGAPEGEPEMEGGEEGTDLANDIENDGDIESEIASLSDEDFQKLAQAVDAVAAQRQGGSEEEPAPETEGEPVNKAMYKAPKKVAGGNKADGGKAQKHPLMKSFNSLVGRLEELEKAMKAPAAKYADTSKVKILEKSAPAGEPLNGKELADWLLGQQRQGNRLVKSLHVAKANIANEDSLPSLYAELGSLGIKLPTK